MVTKKIIGQSLLITILISYASFFFLQPLWNNTLLIGLLSLFISSLAFVLVFFADEGLVKQSIYLSIAIIVSFLFIGEAHNDYYRYLWDGWLINNGISPFILTPEALSIAMPGLSNVWYWQFLDFKHLHTIYGTVSEVVFSLAGLINPRGLFGLRLMMSFFALGIIKLLWILTSQEKCTRKWIPLVVLSPVFLFDGIAGVHTEMILTFFLLLSILLYKRDKYFWLGVSIAMMVMTKFYPILLLPFFLSKKNYVKTGSAFLLSFIVLSIPMFFQNGYLNILASLDRFANQWTAFPGINHLIKWGIESSVQLSIPKTSMMVLLIGLIITMIYLFIKKMDLVTSLFVLLAVFIFLSETVFSWYWLPLFALFPMVKSKYKYVVLWPMIMFSLQYMFIVPNNEVNSTFIYQNNVEIIGYQLLFWLPAYMILAYLYYNNKKAV